MLAVAEVAKTFGDSSADSKLLASSATSKLNVDRTLVFFVESPNQKAFAGFIQDPGYLAIRHLREVAIRDSLLVRCKRK